MAYSVALTAPAVLNLRGGLRLGFYDAYSKFVALDTIAKTNFVALFDLLELCKNPDYPLVKTTMGDSKSILLDHKLIIETHYRDQDGKYQTRYALMNASQIFSFHTAKVHPLTCALNSPTIFLSTVEEQSCMSVILQRFLCAPT